MLQLLRVKKKLLCKTYRECCESDDKNNYSVINIHIEILLLRNVITLTYIKLIYRLLIYKFIYIYTQLMELQGK